MLGARPGWATHLSCLRPQDYDENGDYARTWLPELKNVPGSHIHEPWKMNQEQQKQYGCIIGQDYPQPIRQPRPGECQP